MYVLVITQKKRFRIFLIILGAILIFAGLFQLISLLIPHTEITLEQRLSVVFPSRIQMSSFYMTTSDWPYIKANSILGNKWETEKIQQLNMPEISFQYPETIRLGEIINLGQEITIHINFKHTNNKMNGFFQVWKLNQPLEKFLDNSKKFSSMTFMDFKDSQIKVQDMNGYVWEYTFVSTTEDIKGFEAFVENGSEMYRFSIFVPNNEYKSEYKRLFMRIVKSLRIKNTVAAELI